jgi:hypothetical protein
MDFAILDPSILHISEEDWFDEIKRDAYLEHFLNMLSGVNDNKNIALAWSHEFEELFWSPPQQLPWNKTKCWSNSIIPVVYNLINRNADFIDIKENVIDFEIDPNINYERDDFYSLFVGLIVSLHKKCTKIAVCFSVKNIPPKDHKFRVNGEYLIPDPTFISNQKDFLKIIDVSENYWPNRSNDSELVKNGISTILRRDYGKEKAICSFSLSNQFISKLSNTSNDRDKIFKAIAKRLSMTKADAGRDGSLKDEDVAGKKNIRRFRVTGSKRIHYLDKAGSIEFLMFYDEGEHDDGL